MLSKVSTSLTLQSTLFICSLLDLIRHGKHHHHARQDNKSTDKDTLLSPSSPRGFHQQQQLHQAQLHQDKQNNKHNSDIHHHPLSPNSPASREAAQIIVNEEREAKAKMPSYPGLDNFKLVEKMGECVPSCLTHPLQSHPILHPAVPFPKCTRQSISPPQRKWLVSMISSITPLYTQRRHCPAVKVVRKFELSSSQVSVSFLLFAPLFVPCFTLIPMRAVSFLSPTSRPATNT